MTWQSEIVLNALAYVCAAVGGAAIVGLLVASRPRLLSELWPPPSRAMPSLIGPEVLFTFILVLFIPGLTRNLLEQTGFFSYFFATPPTGLRKDLYGAVLDLPLFLGAVYLVLRRCDLTFRQIGISGWRWPQNLTLGYIGFLAGTPIILGTYFLTRFVFEELRFPSDPHPMEKLARETLLPIEWALMLFRVAVAAAITEELVFRGLLLNLLPQSPLIAHMILPAVVLAITAGTAFANPSMSGHQEFVIMFFGLTLVGGYSALLIWGVKKSAHVPTAWPLAYNAHGIIAIYGSSMLWAMFHVSIWPSPIPLFFMGLGLGWLSWRTQSLIGPIVWHSLFNCVAFLVLEFNQLR